MLSPTLYFVLLLYGAADISLGTSKKCFMLTADIVFAVDSSFSIRLQDYFRQLAFLKAVVDHFTIGHNHVQIGVISFSSTVRLDIHLNNFTTKRDLKEAVGNIQQIEGGTNTFKAIKFARRVMYEPDNGGRPWSKKQLVLITDGLSSNISATLLEASIAKSVGIEVFSILVGEVADDIEIRGVASDPKEHHVFRVESYKALVGIENSLSSAACHSVTPMDSKTNNDDFEDGDDDDVSDDPTVAALMACKRNAADVIFLMDSSSSIWEPDFIRQITFIQQVTSNFDLGTDTTRVAVVVYSDTPFTLVDLSDEQKYAYLHHALSKAPHITGGTNTALAINHARKLILANGMARPHAAHVIIILSDGQSNDMKRTIDEAFNAQNDGIQIFAVGIGEKTDISELMAMASDPDDQFVFHVNDYQALSEIYELLAMKTCDAASSSVQPVACPSLPTDVVFIYDTTALSRHHHDNVINIISEVTQSGRFNNHELRVGVMREASSESSLILHDIELTNQWDHLNFKSKLDPDFSKASVDILFRKARRKYFHPTMQFDYISHKRTIVVFLDSLLQNPFGATIEAIRLRRSHVNVVVVTLGMHINMRDVLSLASSPHGLHIISAANVHVHQMRNVVSKLLAVLCE